MAITISGQNNNDKILASDGVLDSISGFNVVGVMTATQFDVTTKHTANHIDVGSSIQLGNAGIITATTLIGNVTGNVNSTSHLLLQISGSEKFRVGNGGQLGIGGANYGTSGQVLTSGGSGSAASWSTISGTTINNNAANKVIMGSNTANTLEAVAKSTLFGNLSHGQNFLDDQNLVFGDASDMILIHTSSGAKSRLRNTNDSGSLDIESTLTRFLNKDGSTEKLRIDSGGRLLIGTNSSLQTYGANPSLQVAGTSFDTSTLLLRRDENNANPPAIVLGKSRGSAGGNTVVQDDDQVGSLIFAAADGTDLTSIAAEIKVQIDGTPGSNDVPGRITFNTTADGAANPTERLRIDSSGRVMIGSGAYIGGAALAVIGSSTTPNTYGCFAIGRSGANVTNNDTIANIRLNGGTVGTGRGAEINAAADANWSDGSSHPTRLTFHTVASSSTSATERLRINRYGGFGLAGANFGEARQTIVSGGASGAVSWSSNPFLLDMAGLGDIDYDGVFLRYRETADVTGNGLVYLGLCKSTTNCTPGRIGIPVGFIPGVTYNSHFRVDKVGITPWPDGGGHRYEFYVIISDWVSTGKLGIFYLTNSTN